MGSQFARRENRNTVQLRNIPRDFTRDHFLQLLDHAGFFGRYCFVYLPMDFTHGKCVGYADVCLVDSVDAMRMLRAFNGFDWNASIANNVNLPAICETAWSERQNASEHIARYRDSPI